ncbi:MAG: LCP family protein, partial [Oscillospiraceae bacterium]|nr:LCP family protein [Oscillospiraceae bacterium]
MKLIGTSGRPKHTGARRADGTAHGGKHLAKKKKKTGLRVFITIVVILAVIVLAGAAAWKYFVKPPEVSGERPTGPSWTDKQEPDGAGEAQAPVVQDPDPQNPAQETRTGGEYTFALLGTDDGNGNTDTIMVVDFDADDYQIDVVSIPRDTLVNVSWNVKKINSLYGVGLRSGVGGPQRTMEGLSDILGFDLDFYVVVDLTAFEKLVDAIGGVYYDVPVTMKYSDPAQDLYIDIAKGPQTLSGKDAVKVMRFRSGYADA